MTQHNEQPPQALEQLSSREMQEVLGGASADFFLKLRSVDGEATNRAAAHNGGVWKASDFPTRY